MSRYERAYGTDWETLDKDEAIDRAYALGVATTLGEYHPDELDAIRAEMDSAYDRSVVELAFDEGKNEGRELTGDGSGADQRVWTELVEGVTVTVDDDDSPTGGRTGLPEALDRADLFDKRTIDTTDAVDLPEFLEKE